MDVVCSRIRAQNLFIFATRVPEGVIRQANILTLRGFPAIVGVKVFHLSPDRWPMCESGMLQHETSPCCAYHLRDRLPSFKGRSRRS